MLHEGSGNKQSLKSDKEAAMWTRNGDSNSTEEDDKERPSLHESGISQAYPQPESQTLRDEDPDAYHLLEEQKEESETERSLEHYNEERKRQAMNASNLSNGIGGVPRDIGEADELYVHTTSECVSKSKSRAKHPREDLVGQFDQLLQHS